MLEQTALILNISAEVSPVQAVADQIAASPKVIVFPMGKRKPKPKPLEPAPELVRGYNPSKHGNFAQWFSAIVSSAAIILTLYFHFTASESKTADEHVNTLIADKLDPAIKNVTINADHRFDAIEQKLDDLSAKINDAAGQLKRMKANENPQDRQRFFASIKAEINAAKSQRRSLPPTKLAAFKSQMRELPQSGGAYWNTVAAIINYQSFIEQMNGRAPDPAAVSRACSGLTEGTGGNNRFDNMEIANCVVDLDSSGNILANVVFKNSVIHYHGGPVNLQNVRFVNCSFVLDIPVSSPSTPERNQLLMTLLEAPDSKTVTISTRS